MAERRQEGVAVVLLKKLVGMLAIVATVTVSAGVDGCIQVIDVDAPAAPLVTGTNGFDQRLVGQWSPWFETRKAAAPQKADADRHLYF